MKKKCETCKHACSTKGHVTVLVNESCPKKVHMHDKLVSTRRICQMCDKWESRGEV